MGPRIESMSRCGRGSRALAMVLALAMLTAVAAGPAAAQGDLERRWELEETPYAQQNFLRKIGSNVRDGTVGLIDSLAQGLFGAVAIFNPRSGGLAIQKLSTFGGDVIGLVDNNPVTKHVTKGILSRQLLRFGAGARRTASGIAFLHDTEFDIPMPDLEEYVGDSAFHPQAYIRPSIVFGLGGIVVSNFVVRPVGNVLMIFGLRETGESIDQWGIDLIESSLKVPFL